MPIIDDLAAYYSLGEASGNALDAHSGALHLTETSGTIASATGKVGNCRDFELADTEYFTRVDSAALSLGDIDATLIYWCQLESIPGEGVFADVVTKDAVSGSDREFFSGVVTTGGVTRFRIVVWDSGGTLTSLLANNFGTPSTATWYFVVVRHNSVTNVLEIQVNGVSDSVSYSAGIRDAAAPFRIGARGNATGNWDGLIDEVGLWKRALTDDELVWLYNTGSGRSYAEIVAGIPSGGIGPILGGKALGNGRILGGSTLAC